MNPKTLMMLAGGGLVLYYLMSSNKPTTTTTSSGGGGGTPGNVKPPDSTSPPPPPPVTPPAPGFNSLASIYQRLTAAATAAGVGPGGMGPDAWNYYLAQVSNISVPPDPMAVFPGIDRSKPLTAVQYWSGMSDYLAKNSGMSGLSFYPRSRYWHMSGGWAA